MILRCLGYGTRKRDVNTLLYADTFTKPASGKKEATVRNGGFCSRLSQRVMFGEVVGGKGCSGGQEKDRNARLKEDMTEFGIKVRRVAKGCTEGRKTVSTGQGWGRDVHAEMA